MALLLLLGVGVRDDLEIPDHDEQYTYFKEYVSLLCIFASSNMCRNFSDKSNQNASSPSHVNLVNLR